MNYMNIKFVELLKTGGIQMNKILDKVESYTWKGFRDFIVYKKVYESKDIISLYLKPNDHLGIAEMKPGQFIGIKVKTEDDELKKVLRMYSLSSIQNDDYYRVTIKVVEDGKLTTYLDKDLKEGDLLEVMTPRGNFKLEKENIKRPIVLLGGGIGVTPVYSMLKDIDDSLDTYFVYSLRNKESQCFLKEINSYKNSKNTKVEIFFTRPLKNEKLGIDYDFQGRISKEWIKDNLPLHGEFFFCGNKGFIETVKEALESLDVDKERIHYEFF